MTAPGSRYPKAFLLEEGSLGLDLPPVGLWPLALGREELEPMS